jgi:hypothetical protein
MNNLNCNYIEIYSNVEHNYKPFSFINKLNDNNIYTKAIDLWNYYKNNVNKKIRVRQKDFYNKISKYYGLPIKKNGVNCYINLIIAS